MSTLKWKCYCTCLNSHYQRVNFYIVYQRESLENASTTSVILNTLSYAAKASKEAFNNLNIDDVNNLQDDLAEQRGKD